MAGEILQPISFTLPKMGSTAKYAMGAEIGTMVYDTGSSKVSFCVSSAVGSAAWEVVTSTAE